MRTIRLCIVTIGLAVAFVIPFGASASTSEGLTCTAWNNWCIPMLSDPPGYFLHGADAYYVSPSYGALIRVHDIADISTWGGYASPTAMFRALGLAGVEALIIDYQDEHQMQPPH